VGEEVRHMWKCLRCGSEVYDVLRFLLPKEMPMALAIAVPRNVRSELAKLFENYQQVEVYICKNCGYTELRFVRRE
jgi:predicted nucleic-acid-binding Zn-ribbon protein